MKSKISTLITLCLFVVVGITAQTSYPITLKVIDETKSITKGSGTGLNAVVKIDDNLKAQNPRTPNPTSWWLQMYYDSSEIINPHGTYTENADNLTWEITLNATPGTYTWTPYLKSTGWKFLNNNYKYAESGSEAISFTVNDDGTISGMTELVVKKQAFTLKVVDQTKTVTKGSGNGTNVITWLDSSLKSQNPRTPDDWWLPMYADVAVMPNGIYTENANDLTWEIELQALPGTYKWKPCLKTGAPSWGGALNEAYKYAEEPEIEFTVYGDGRVTGTTELTLSKYPVTLKVVDLTKNVTKGSGSGQNVIVEMSSDLKTQNPRNPSPTEWWVPMYNDASITPHGTYSDNTNDMTWEIDLEAGPGTYTWTPYLKARSWSKLNNTYKYAEDAAISFTVAPDGTISGDTELTIQNTKFPITLKVVDKTKGRFTSATTFKENNVTAWVGGGLNPTSSWFYGFYNGDSKYPNGELIKGEEDWTWQATFEGTAGIYEWNPGMKSLGTETSPKTMNGNLPGIGWPGSNLKFVVGSDGTLSEDYQFIMEEDPDNPIVSTYLTLNVNMNWQTVSSEGVYVTGSFNGWSNTATKMEDPDGDGIYTVKIEVTQSNTAYEYKFINGTSWSNVETVFGPCEFRSNRIALVNNGSLEMPPVAFGYCTAEPSEMEEIKVACIGGSSTEGAGTSNKSQYSWPIQLRSVLGSKYYTENLGVSGKTQQDLPGQAWRETSQYNYTIQLNPDIILMVLGTNDTKTSNWDAARFKADYLKMVNEFKALPSSPEVFLVMPGKIYPNVYGASDENMFNGVMPVIREMSKEYMLPVIDYYVTTEDPSLFSDGLHPTDHGASVIADKVGEVLLTSKPNVHASAPSATNPGETPGTGLYFEYRWYKDGVLIDNSDKESIIVTESGTYNVAVKLYDDADDIIISDPVIVAIPDNNYVKLSLTKDTEFPSALTFEGLETIYDGNPHSVSVARVPDGFTVSYNIEGESTNERTNGGEYIVEATITHTATSKQKVMYAKLVIGKGEQTITFDELPVKNDTDAPFTLVATSSAGLPVSFTSSDEQIASISGNVVTIHSFGDIDITAIQLGNESYNAAEPVVQKLSIISSNTDAVIKVNGVEWQNVDNHFVADCNYTGSNQLTVEVVPQNGATISLGQMTVDISKPINKQLKFIVVAQDGKTTEEYSFFVERYFDFDNLVKTRWNNTMTVINNPLNNGGYRFNAYEWYKNDQLVSTDQSYSAGQKETDKLNPSDRYQVVVTTTDGQVIHSCEGSPVLKNMTVSAYPNPVSAGDVVYVRADVDNELLEGASIDVYTISGERTGSFNVQGEITPIQLQGSAGTYIFKFRGKDGFSRDLKVIRK